ncbi:MAG: hypothetical protein GTN93_07335, partial [Anaerolineae bacterium]|nr:hypothetical protein [Anaerolineae bacterium]
LEDFAAEINGILKLCNRPCRVILHESDIIDDFEAEEIPTVIQHLKGGGGTNFIPVFERIAQDDKAPPVLVFLTDLYGPLP